MSGQIFPGWFPWGSCPGGFTSSDYFPIFPNLGYFLLGAAAGKRFYGSKTTLLPKGNEQNPVIRFFCFLGRHSLTVYLLHQPIAAGLVGIWVLLTQN